jgi:hypothetical protein
MDYQSAIPLTAFLSKAGLAVGTTTTTTTTNSATFLYAINGKAYNATGASNGATPTTDANTGAAFVAVGLNKACVFVFGYNAAGSLVCAQGSIVDYDNAGTFAVAPQFPAIPDNFCPIGYELVKVISTGSAWTMGTSNQASQTGITKVMVDCITLPARPQVS